MATLSSYTTIVQNEVDDNSATRKPVIEQAIQDTYQEIIGVCLIHLVGTTEENVVATPDQRYVTPTNDFQIVKKVFYHASGDTDFYELHEIREDEYYSRYINNDSSDPAYYYRSGNNIYFDVPCTDAGTVKVVGIIVQDELSGSTTSIIPDRYERVLILGSIARFKAFEGLPEASNYFTLYHGPYNDMGRLGGELKRMKEELSIRTRKLRPRIYGF